MRASRAARRRNWFIDERSDHSYARVPSMTESRPQLRRILSLLACASSIAAGAWALTTCRSQQARALDATRQTNAPQRFGEYDAALYRGLIAFRVSVSAHGGVAADNTGRFGLLWTKCTNLGFDLLTELVAESLGLVSEAEAADHVQTVLGTLEQLRSFHGIFPEFIQLSGVPHAEVKDGKVRFSSLDSAWVTLALSIAEARYRDARPELARRTEALIDQQDYGALLDSNRLLGGLSIDAMSGSVVDRATFAYGDRNSEARPLVLSLIGMHKVPAEVWDSMSYSWTDRAGLAIAEGYHASAFVELSGQLFFDEMALAPRSLGQSHANYVAASATVARAKEQRLWGYAPSCEPPDGYTEFGLDRPDVVTPYAAAELATTGQPLAAANLQRVLQSLDWSGAPVADALDPTTGRSLCASARMLDQSLLFLALNVDALRALSRRTSWYSSAEARIRDMDRTHPAPEPGSR
jgi:hypothetical protein